jgi:hypothetical protein
MICYYCGEQVSRTPSNVAYATILDEEVVFHRSIAKDCYNQWLLEQLATQPITIRSNYGGNAP